MCTFRLSHESLTTHLALLRPLVTVTGFMPSKPISRCERFWTQVTLVGFFTGMASHVLLQFRLINKTSVTDFTFEWELNPVLLHVNFERILMHERLSAKLALVLLGIVMRKNMFPQTIFSSKFPSAHFTLVIHFVAM